MLNLHERGDDTTAVADTNLHGNGDSTLDAPTDVVSIPHDQDWNHGIHARSSEESACVLSSRNVSGDEEGVANEGDGPMEQEEAVESQ